MIAHTSCGGGVHAGSNESIGHGFALRIHVSIVIPAHADGGSLLRDEFSTHPVELFLGGMPIGDAVDPAGKGLLVAENRVQDVSREMGLGLGLGLSDCAAWAQTGECGGRSKRTDDYPTPTEGSDAILESSTRNRESSGQRGWDSPRRWRGSRANPDWDS